MKSIILLLAALAFAISPFLNPEFGGFDPDRYPIPQIDPPVQPAGYAFAIWGPIYLWLIVSAIFGLWKRREDTTWEPMRLPLALSLAVGAAWLPVALISPIIATVMIWIMLLAALAAFDRAPATDTLWAKAPIGLYAGWLTAASFVAVGLLFAGYGWMSETTASVVCLLGALALAALVIRHRPSLAYGAAVVWALIAVAAQNWAQSWALTALALGGGALIAVLTALRLQQK
ncbi:hypothetical protein [Oceaniglobus ichthyenteri]|uniref:hypothetical protein n=1 Tax=Oceaniglobus ichthyenteri TaxID=2136177 RepID=UPI000D38AAED|nr:hypothetical protein [Oceaniglobus ichthyenteri]